MQDGGKGVWLNGLRRPMHSGRPPASFQRWRRVQEARLPGGDVGGRRTKTVDHQLRTNNECILTGWGICRGSLFSNLPFPWPLTAALHHPEVGSRFTLSRQRPFYKRENRREKAYKNTAFGAAENSFNRQISCKVQRIFIMNCARKRCHSPNGARHLPESVNNIRFHGSGLHERLRKCHFWVQAPSAQTTVQTGGQPDPLKPAPLVSSGGKKTLTPLGKVGATFLKKALHRTPIDSTADRQAHTPARRASGRGAPAASCYAALRRWT